VLLFSQVQIAVFCSSAPATRHFLRTTREKLVAARHIATDVLEDRHSNGISGTGEQLTGPDGSRNCHRWRRPGYDRRHPIGFPIVPALPNNTGVVVAV
jgi:hypothetical protein